MGYQNAGIEDGVRRSVGTRDVRETWRINGVVIVIVEDSWRSELAIYTQLLRYHHCYYVL